jgi:hypothetical protein
MTMGLARHFYFAENPTFLTWVDTLTFLKKGPCFSYPPFDHEGRRQAVRASMRADWYMPVVWAGWEESLEQARSVGFTVIGIEDVGRRAPWEVDLTGPVLLVVGAEERGIPRSCSTGAMKRCGSP